LDYGRFFAAMMVVVFHYTFNSIVNGKIESITLIPSVISMTKYGYLGVEFFFMISGYVIFFSARNKTAAEFAESRFLRLYPAYWFAILFTSAFALRWGGESMSVELKQVIANFTMMQFFMGVRDVDGVYWSLVYEMIFYLAVFLLLLFGLQKHLKSIAMIWPALFCIAIVTGTEATLYLGGYFYYFAAGTLFAVLAENKDLRAVFGLIVTYALCLKFSAGVADDLTRIKGVEHSSLVIGLVVTAFFGFFMFQNSEKGQSLRLPKSRLAGALSYPIYLIHANFGAMFLSTFATEENKLFLYLLTISIVLTTAFFIHLVVENRLRFVWKWLFHNAIGRPLGYIQDLQEQLLWRITKRPRATK
jgi:peptidoglycan/LPS O-acetylase OafA/YrhL